MVTTLTKPNTPAIPKNGNGDFGGGHFRDVPPSASPFDARQIGLLFFMATVTMLFGGVISSLMIRRASPDWKPIDFPFQLWINTAIILLSSATLEFSRRALRKSDSPGYRFWISLSTILGFAFLVGQVMVWHQLRLAGIFLPSSPHASFFYLLTGLHAVHLASGVIVLLLASMHALRSTLLTTQVGFFNIAALYWHFLDFLWIALFIVLFVM